MTFAERLAKNAEREKKVEEKFNKNNPLTPYRGTYQKNMISEPLLKTNTPEKPNFSQALPSFNTIQQNKAEHKFENANNVENEAKEFASIIFQKYGNTDSFRASLEKATTDFANNYKGDYKEAPTVFKNTMGTLYTETLLTDLITNPSIDNYNSFVNKVNSKSNSLVKPTYNGSDLLAVASSIMYKNNKDFNIDNDAYAKKIFGNEEKNISVLENQKNEKTKKKQDKSLFDRVNDLGEEAGDMALQAAGILLPGKFGDKLENEAAARRDARQEEKDKEANLGNEISALNEEIEYRKSNLYSQKKYYELSRKSDFEKNSKFIEGKTPSLNFGDDKAVRMGLVVSVPEKRKKELNKLGYDNLGYTPEQKKVAYYIANTQGKDAAQEYIDNLKGMTSVNSANYLKIRDGEHIGTKMGYQVLAGMESLYNIPTEIKNTFTINTEYKTADTTTLVADMMASEAKGAEKIILGGTRGIIELAPSLAITAATGGAGAGPTIAKIGSLVSKGIFAGNVYAKSYREAVNSGNDWSTATGFGLGSAGLELGLEQLSGITLGGTTPKVSFGGKVASKFDDIFKSSPKLRAVASTAGRLAENYAGEFTEEYLADVFNPVLRNAFLGENNEFKVYDYEFVESGLIGGFTGAVLGSPSFVTNIARTFKPGNYGANVAFYNTAFDGVLENEMFKSNNKVFEGMDKEQKSEAINRYRAEKIYEAAYDSIFGYVSQAVIEGNSVDYVFDNLKKEGIDTAEYKDEINHAYDVASASTGPSARLTAFAEKELAKGGTIGSVVKALTDDGSIIGKISEFDGLEGNELTKAVRKKVSSVQKESGFLKTVNELINKGESTYGIFDNIYEHGGSFINAFRDADGDVNIDDALRTIENAQKNAIAKEIKIKNIKGSDAIKFMDDAMTRLEQKNTEYRNNAKATNNKVNAINTVSESVLNSIKTTAKADASLSDINTAVSEAIITSDFSSENFTGKLASIYTDALRSKNANAYIAVSQSGIDIPDALITYKESGTIPENVNSNAFKAIGDAFNGITESAITQVEAARTALANDVADSASEGKNGAGEAENAPVEEVVSWSEEDIKDISTEEREKTQKTLEGMGYNGEREYNRIMKAVNKSPNKSTKVFDAFRTAFAYLYEHGYKNEAFDPAKVKILGVKNIERIFNAGAKDKTAKQAVKRKDKGVVIKDAAYKAAKLSKREAKMLDGIAAITGRDIRFDATLPGNAKIDLNTGEIVISTTATAGSAWAMIHEVFHAMSVSAPAEARLLKNTILDIVRKNSRSYDTLLEKYADLYGVKLLDENRELIDDANQYVSEEVVCDLLGYVISRPDILSTITGEQRNVIQRFIDRLVSYFTSKDILDKLGLSDETKSAFLEVGKEAKAIAEMFRKALEAEKVQAQAMSEVKEAEKKTVTEDGVKHSLIGFAEDGRKIYKTNYPDNTPKLTKQLDVIALVQHIWQKKPITLSIFEDGKTKQIKAKFDPTLEPRSDLSKIAFGNRKGTGSEKRITLNLSYDLYQIASDATFTRKKDEVGKKENPAHDDVNEWLYFVTNLVYEENDGSRTECYMNIDVKRKDDGEYFYSFAIEKGTAPQTLLAEVSEVNPPTVPNNHYTQNDGNVNTKNERESKDISETDSEGKELTEKQVEYFGNSKVRDKNGALKIMYRGDANEFTVFDRKKSKASNLYGRGFYFTDSKSHAQQYGNATEYYLNIINPLSPGQNSITKAQMLNFLKAIENDGEDYDLYNYGENATAETVLEEVWGKDDFAMLQDINAGAIGDLVAAIELFNEVNGTNYDGIILPTETVTFKSNQAKKTSNKAPTVSSDTRMSKDLSGVDSEGKALTPEQAEYFKDSLVRDDNGNLLKVYHGSGSEFTVFNHKFLNTHGNSHGRGFYFTEKKSLAEGYSEKGGQLLEGYLNITKPLSEDKVTMKKADLIKLIKATCKAEAQEYVADGGYETVAEALPDTWISNYVDTYSTNLNDAYREVADIIYSGNDNDVEIISEITNAGAGNENTLKLTKDVLGYDGVIYTANDGTHEFVSLVSEQFKNADNVNPTDNPDVRWSKDLSSYTKEEYEAFGWVRYNDILSVGEYADFTSKFAAALSKHIKSYKSKNGEYIIPVSDIKDESVYTIDNVLVFAKGTIDKPIITSIIRIDLYNETELDVERRNIYELERRGIQQKTGDLFRRYYASDFAMQYESEIHESRRNSNDNRYGRRSGEEASKTEGTGKLTTKSDLEKFSKDISESLDGKQMSESKIKSLAGRLRRTYRSKFEKDQLISSLSDIYTMLAEQRYEDAKTASQSLAERMLDEVKDDVIVNDAAKDILNDIRGTKVWFNDKQIAEAKHYYGNLWHERFFGKVIVSKEAKTSLDQQWQEWCEKYPDYFKSDVIDANMPIKLIEIIEGLKREKHTVVKPDISDAVIPLATDIYNGVWNSAVRRKLTDEEKASIAELKGAGKGLTSQQKLDLIKAVRQDELKRWGVALGMAENADTGSRMSLSEIIKKVEESFGINITHGSDATVKKEGVSGAYNYDSKTVRTKLRNDLPSIAHAIGYHIDNKLKLIDDIIDQTQAVRVQNGDGEGIYETELKRLAGDFTSAKGSREMIREGFAEFIRTYLASKPLAMETAGNFYSYFESKLKEDDKLLNAVNEAADTIGKYFAQGYEERAGAAIITQKEWEKLNKPKGKEKLNVIRNGINKWLFDRFYGIKQAEKNNEMFDLTTSDNAWVKATLSLNSTARASRILDDGFFDSNGNRVGEGFYEIIKDLGDTESTKFKAFSEYLGYVHALEWVAPNKVVIDGKNLTATKKPVFADAHLNDPEVLKGLIAKAEKNNPDFKPTAERLYKYQDNLMEYYLIPSGAMSKEQADKFRKQYPHYVPFNRFNTVLGGGKPKTNVFANLSNPIKLATGGSAEIRNPIESIINSTFAAVDFKAKNDTMLSLINEFTNGVFPGTMERIYSTKELEKLEEKGNNPFATEEWATYNQNKDASYSPVIDKDKGIVYAWVNGEKRFYQIYDKELYNAVANLDVKNLGALFRFLNTIGNAMKTTMTMKNPLFALGNFYRDFMTFHYNSTADVNLISHLAMYIGAFKSMIIKDQYYQRYKALGGMDTGRFLADLDAISRSATVKKLNTKKWSDVHSVKDAYKKFTKNQNILKYLWNVLWEKAFALNDAFEAAPRLAEFKYTMQQTSDSQLAMFRANDVTTNFARSGIAGRHLNSIFLFSNASLQGFDKMVRTYTDAKYVKKSEDGKFDKNRLAKVIIKNVTWSVILAALQSFLNRRDEEAEEAYNNLSEFTKNNYDVFYIGDGKFFKLPKEQNLAIPRTFIQRIMDATQGDGVDWRELGDYIWSALTPGFVPDLSEVYTLDFPGVIHGVVNNTAIGVITDVGFNRDYKDDEIVPSYMSGANYEKYYPYTSSFSVKFAKKMFDASGGAIDVSPIAIDHYMSAGGYYGSLYKKFFPYTDVEEKGIGGSIVENAADAIGLNTKFVVDNTYSTDILDNFYEGRELAEKKLGIDDSAENKIISAKYKSVGTFISKYNKTSKNGTGDQQRLDRRMLIEIINGYDGSELTEGEKYLIHVLDETQNEDLLKLNYPSNEFKSKQFKVNGEKFKTEVSLGANEYAQMCSEIDSARAKALLFIKSYGFSEEEAAVYIVDAFKAIDEEYKAKYLDLYGKDIGVEVEEKIVSSKDKEKVREEVLGNVIPQDTTK